MRAYDAVITSPTAAVARGESMHIEGASLANATNALVVAKAKRLRRGYFCIVAYGCGGMMRVYSGFDLVYCLILRKGLLYIV